MNNYKPTDLGSYDYIFIGSEIWTKEELAECQSARSLIECWRWQRVKQGK